MSEFNPMPVVNPTPTPRRRKPAAAQPSLAAELRTMLHGIVDPAFLMSADGRVLDCNAAAEGIAERLAAFCHPSHRGLKLSAKLVDGETTRWFDLSSAVVGGDDALVLARETTLERNLRDALIDSRRRYKDLVEMASDFSWETDAEGAFVFVSPAEVLGYHAADIIGRKPASFLVDADHAGAPLPFDATKEIASAEFWAVDAAGASRCLVTAARPVFDRAGERTGVRGVCRDATAERLREAEMAQAFAGDSVLAHILSTMREAIEPRAILDAACAAIAPALSATGCRLYRARADGSLRPIVTTGNPVGDAAAPDVGTAPGVIAADARYRRQLKGRIVLWRDPAAGDWTVAEGGLLAKVADQLGVALAEMAERETLERLSATDPLTDLMNRRAFADRLEQRVGAAAAEERRGALLYVDLDNFKQVNDRAGHDAGDAVLRAVAALLRRTGRPADLAARLGGDEFALWVDDVDEQGALHRAERIMAGVAELRRLEAAPDNNVGMSIGLAVFDPASRETVDALVRRADAAMYESKRAGKSRVTRAKPAGCAS